MSGADLRNARREREWTQAELADRLGVSQAYVCLLERNRRAVPRRLAQRLASVLKLSPSTLPMSAGRASLKPEEATAALGAVGYPGFAYLRNRRPLNPADLVLRVLRAGDVDARVVEALPWVLLKYPDLDWAWLVREAKVRRPSEPAGIFGVRRPTTGRASRRNRNGEEARRTRANLGRIAAAARGRVPRVADRC